MWSAPWNDQYADEIFLAGELVPAGHYKQTGAKREIQLLHDDFLPPSCDGRVACYLRVGSLGKEGTRSKTNGRENHD